VYKLWLNCGLLLIVAGLVAGCDLFAPSPTPTLVSSFVTTTPTSPTLSLTATPTITPTSTTSPATPLPPDYPHAVINHAGGLFVRPGPGLAYNPPLGRYDDQAVVTIIGQAYSPQDGELWWLIPFVGPQSEGWIYANYTTAYNVEDVPWVLSPPLPPAPTPSPSPPRSTATSTSSPYVIVDSYRGFVEVRAGPGDNYDFLGRYNNGTTLDLIGQQYSTQNRLWWVIRRSGDSYREGWIPADQTRDYNAYNVRWVPAPPTPTSPPPTLTLTPTPTPTTNPFVTWSVTGRLIDATNGRPIAGASITANLGNDGTQRTLTSDATGQFSVSATARNDGNLFLSITANGYNSKSLTDSPRSPRTYNLGEIPLLAVPPAKVTWRIAGRVTELGTSTPIAGARVDALLGDETFLIGGVTTNNGDFLIEGEAEDTGSLQLTITAEGYETQTFAFPPRTPRDYSLLDLQLTPLPNSCTYRSVLNLLEAQALAELQSLRFTNVTTRAVSAGSPPQVGVVLEQLPTPPAAGQSQRLDCQTAVRLGIGN
jgi:hypothetical protein